MCWAQNTFRLYLPQEDKARTMNHADIMTLLLVTGIVELEGGLSMWSSFVAPILCSLGMTELEHCLIWNINVILH